MNGTAIAERQHTGLVVGAGQFEHREQVEHRAGAEKRDQQPKRQIAVMAAFHRDREFRIGEGQIDNGAEPVALDLFGDDIAEDLRHDERGHRDPKRLAADAAVKLLRR